MRRAVVMRVVACLMWTTLILLGGCGDRRRQLNIGADLLYAPWCYIDERTGRHTGFDVELARRVCARLGMRPVFHAIEFSKKEELLEKGTIDCVWGAFTVTGREREYAALGPYADNALVILAQVGAGIQTAEDLSGKVVLAQAGTTSEAVLRPGGEAERIGRMCARIISTPNAQQSVRCLRDGLADALVLDVDTARYYEKLASGRLKIIPGEPLRREGIGVGFRRKDRELRDRVAAVLTELAHEGVCAQLAEEFLGGADRFKWGAP